MSRARSDIEPMGRLVESISTWLLGCVEPRAEWTSFSDCHRKTLSRLRRSMRCGRRSRYAGVLRECPPFGGGIAYADLRPAG